MGSGSRVPTSEQMMEIQEAVLGLAAAVLRWREREAYRFYPAEARTRAALRAVFDSERALNPGRLPWGDPARHWPDARGWDAEEVAGLRWYRNLIDGLIAGSGFEAIATAADFEGWIGGRLGEIRGVEFEERWVAEFVEAIATLRAFERPEAPETLIEEGYIYFPDGTSWPAEYALAPPAPVAPVVLHGPPNPPVVMGRRANPITVAQYHVVEALLSAGEAGLSLAELKVNSGHEDARAVMGRLRDAHPDTWGRVLISPGLGRTTRYRIGMIPDPHLAPF